MAKFSSPTGALLGALRLLTIVIAIVDAPVSARPILERPSKPQASPVFRSSANLVTIDATVQDAKGRAVLGLTAADFIVVGNGVAQPVLTVDEISRDRFRNRVGSRPAAPPADVITNRQAADSTRVFVFVVDPDLCCVVLYQRVVDRLIDALGHGDLAAMVFPSKGSLSVDFTNDPDRLRQLVTRMSEAGLHKDVWTTRASLENVMTSLTAIPAARKTIVWVSGGFDVKLFPNIRVAPVQDRGLSSALLETFGRARRLGLPIYTIDPFGLREKPTNSAELLKTAALVSGGSSYVNRSGIVDAAEDLIAESDHFYLLGFDQIAGSDDRRHLELRVSGHPEFRVQTREISAAHPSDADASRGDSLLNSLASGRRQGDLEMQAVALPIADQREAKRARFIVTTSVRYSEAQRTAVAGQDRLRIAILAISLEGKVLATQQRELQISASAALATPITINDVFELPSVPVIFRIGATSTQLGRTGIVSVSALAPPARAKTVQLSAIAIGTWPDSPGTSLEGLRAVIPFAPTTERTFGSSETLQLFAQVLGSSVALRASQAHALLSIASEVQRTQSLELVDVDGVTARITSAIPLKGLTPGSYVLSVRLTAPHQKPVERSLPIRIQ